MGANRTASNTEFPIGGEEYVESMQYLREGADIGQQRQPLQPQNETRVQGKRPEGDLQGGRKGRKRLCLRALPEKR